MLIYSSKNRKEKTRRNFEVETSRHKVHSSYESFSKMTIKMVSLCKSS